MHACFQGPAHILQNKAQLLKRCHPHGLRIFPPQLTLLGKCYQWSTWCRQFLIETVFPNEPRLGQGDNSTLPAQLPRRILIYSSALRNFQSRPVIVLFLLIYSFSLIYIISSNIKRKRRKLVKPPSFPWGTRKPLSWPSSPCLYSKWPCNGCPWKK